MLARETAEPSSTHKWLLIEGRSLEIIPGKPLIHRLCKACGRNFVHDLTAGHWYAAYPRMFDFERLDHNVSARWLLEECPGRAPDASRE